MKILLYTLIYPPDTCSNAFVFADLTTELLKEGDEITVITTTPHYDEEHAEEKKKKLKIGKYNWYRKSNYKDAQVYHIDVIPRKGSMKERIVTFYKFHRYCMKLLKVENIKSDVVICQTPPMTIGIDCKRMARKIGAKSVLIIQDLWLDAMIDAKRIKGIMAKILRKVEISEYRKIDLITTIEKTMGERIHEISGIQPAIIPNFVDASLYRPRTPVYADYEKYGVERDKFILSYVGNLGEAQDLEPLIQYALHNHNAQIIIAGNGIKEDYYKERVKKEGINSILFIGYITREEARIINSISDVCMVMLASHVASTSFPSKIYSLMSMAKPIIISCADSNEAGRFVEEKKIGWKCNVGDFEQFNTVLDSAMVDIEGRKIRGENARLLVQSEYSPESIVRQYKEAIRRII